MELVKPGERLDTASRKDELLREVALFVREAQAIDERETLMPEEWLDWYERNIARVTDSEARLAAMKIEMAVREGERIIADGERRGRPTEDEKENVTSVVTLSDAERAERSRARELAEHKGEVREYVKEELDAGRKPTRDGARRAAKKAKARKQGKRKAQVRAAGAIGRRKSAQVKAEQMLTATVAAVETLNGAGRLSDQEMRRRTHLAPVLFLQRVRFIPWVRIDRDEHGTAMHIDNELRAICDGVLPRSILGGISIAAFLHNLRNEIRRQRKENHDELNKRPWNPEKIIAKKQSRLLDWIEQELDKLPSLASPPAAGKSDAQHVPMSGQHLESDDGISKNEG